MLTFTVKGKETGESALSLQRILSRFQQEGGALLVQAVQDSLGEEAIYSLSEVYKERKPKIKGYRRISGKAQDQPLILSGEMLEAVEWKATGAGFTVGIEDGKALAKDGFDYAEKWNEKTQFLEKALEASQDALEALLVRLIEEELFSGWG